MLVVRCSLIVVGFLLVVGCSLLFLFVIRIVLFGVCHVFFYIFMFFFRRLSVAC